MHQKTLKETLIKDFMVFLSNVSCSKSTISVDTRAYYTYSSYNTYLPFQI